MKYKFTFSFTAVLIVNIIDLTFAQIMEKKEIHEHERKFTIDYENNQFLMDGTKFQYVSGSFHYFRALPDTWRTKLRTMRAGGLNAVDTYVYWGLHNPHYGEYSWTGIADIQKFIEIASEEDLYVILRPGPYICAEIDNGGIPQWLFNKYPEIKIRSSDPNYMKEVANFFEQLMPKIQPHLYGNGGKIIMVQVENEYGVYHECDSNYLIYLRDLTLNYVEDKAVIFTTDIPNNKIRCGKIPDVFATIDFGIDRGHELQHLWEIQRSVQPNGPLVNSEFYPGWLTHWQEENQRRDPDSVAVLLRQMLEDGANVNFYMFFGGTNFGFTAGANDWGIGSYKADLTSYDYDAPMDECGDPTEKYHKIRQVIAEFLPMSSTAQVPLKTTKMTLEDVNLEPKEHLLSSKSRAILGSTPIASEKPLSFEQLDQFSGLVLYETVLPELTIDPSQLTIESLKDRAFVYVNQIFIGTLSRENAIKTLPINAGIGNKLQILVENQGRINFNIGNDTKGIGSVMIQLYDGKLKELINWNTTGFPLKHFDDEIISNFGNTLSINKHGLMSEGPIIFTGQFNINQNKEEIYDTYLNPVGWGKGIIYINGFNLGRYWPLVGPQITIYIPKELLKKGCNTIVMIEYQKAPINGIVKFSTTAELDGNKQQ